MTDSSDNSQTNGESALKPKRGAPIGANKGNRSHESHGIVTFQKSVQRRMRRGRSIIDRRSAAGQSAAAIQGELTADLGGIEHISTAQKILIELVGRDLYLLDETDQRIVKACREWPKLKNSPKGMAVLYGYRVPIINSISRNLLALGLDKKPPPAKTLEEILSEQDGEDQP